MPAVWSQVALRVQLHAACNGVVDEILDRWITGPAVKSAKVLKYRDIKMTHADWKDHIVSTPDVLKGKPRVKGTRIPVSLILGYLAAGSSAEEIINEFPDLTTGQIAACLDYARELSEHEVAA